MAQWQRVGFQTQRLGVRIPLASFFFYCVFTKKNKKRDAETGNRTQAAAATTRSPATRLFRQSPCIGGSGYRSRFSTLRRLYATMYNNPPHRLRPSGLEPESYPWKGFTNIIKNGDQPNFGLYGNKQAFKITADIRKKRFSSWFCKNFLRHHTTAHLSKWILDYCANKDEVFYVIKKNYVADIRLQ